MLKRYLFHKISNSFDAEDILQDVLLSAYKGLSRLKDKNMFKSWIIGIASHKCVDYYKAKAKRLEIPLDALSSHIIDSHGIETAALVSDTLAMLGDKDKQMLYLFYILGYNQKDIALKLNIPTGTVKSRLSTARKNFKSAYPHPPRGGGSIMNKFPKTMPELAIEKIDQKPFSIKCEEIPGWLVIPRVGEKTSFAFYDDPDKRLTGVNTMDCVNEAVIHGIPCVKVDVTEEEGEKVSKHT